MSLLNLLHIFLIKRQLFKIANVLEMEKNNKIIIYNIHFQMKKIILSISCLLLLAFGEVSAQNSGLIYDVASEDVKIKMNSNKILGVNVLDGIDATHVLKVEGLTTATSEQINAILEGSTLISSVDFSIENALIGIVSNANLYRQDIEQMMATSGVTVVQYSVTYALKD